MQTEIESVEVRKDTVIGAPRGFGNNGAEPRHHARPIKATGLRRNAVCAEHPW